MRKGEYSIRLTTKEFDFLMHHLDKIKYFIDSGYMEYELDRMKMSQIIDSIMNMGQAYDLKLDFYNFMDKLNLKSALEYVIFEKRYFYFKSVKFISNQLKMSEWKIRSILEKVRQKAEKLKEKK